MNHLSMQKLTAILSLWVSWAFAWDVQKHKGVDYIKLEELSSFYDFDSYSTSASAITLQKGELSLIFEKGNHSVWINGAKHLMTHPSITANSEHLLSKQDLIYLVDPILRPHYITKNHTIDTIIIDAGHGGKDPGTLCFIGTESTLNLQLAQRLKTKLRRNFGDTVNIILTRDSNEQSLTLAQRVNIAKQHPNSIILSIHGNSISGRGESVTEGLETFIMAPVGTPGYGKTSVTASMKQASPGNNFDQINAVLGSCIHGAAIRYTGAKDRGLKRARFALTQAVNVPGVLIETGFLSHPKERRKLFSPLYQEKITDALVEGLVTYYNLTQFNSKATEIRTLIDMKTTSDRLEQSSDRSQTAVKADSNSRL